MPDFSKLKNTTELLIDNNEVKLHERLEFQTVRKSVSFWETLYLSGIEQTVSFEAFSSSPRPKKHLANILIVKQIGK